MEHGGGGGGAWAVLTGLATLCPWGIADGEDTRAVDLGREGRRDEKEGQRNKDGKGRKRKKKEGEKKGGKRGRRSREGGREGGMIKH